MIECKRTISLDASAEKAQNVVAVLLFGRQQIDRQLRRQLLISSRLNLSIQ